MYGWKVFLLKERTDMPESLVDLDPIERCIRNLAKHKSMVFVFATTTGQGAVHYLNLARKYRLKPVAVAAHMLGNPKWKPFDPLARQAIEELNGDVISEKALWALTRIIGLCIRPLFLKEKLMRSENRLGIGGEVCLQAIKIAIDQGVVTKDQIVIAMAGKNSVFAFEITNVKSIKISLLEVIKNI
jgi:hypothetical protein